MVRDPEQPLRLYGKFRLRSWPTNSGCEREKETERRNDWDCCLLQKFLDDLLRLPDVYFVTSSQVLEWMKKPTALRDLGNFEPWKCRRRHYEPYELACDLPSSCKLPSRVLKSYRYFQTCFECPKQYPWLRNEFGAD